MKSVAHSKLLELLDIATALLLYRAQVDQNLLLIVWFFLLFAQVLPFILLTLILESLSQALYILHVYVLCERVWMNLLDCSARIKVILALVWLGSVLLVKRLEVISESEFAKGLGIVFLIILVQSFIAFDYIFLVTWKLCLSLVSLHFLLWVWLYRL